MKKALIVVLAILAAVFLIGGGYLIGSQSKNPETSNVSTQNETDNLETTTTPSEQQQETFQSPTEIPVTTAPKNVKSLILDAFTTNNFDLLKPVLSDNVMLIAYATSCCGETSDQQKIIDFIKGDPARRGNWELSPQDDKYAQIRSSADIFLIFSTGSALTFNIENEKIKKVTFYSDYRL